MTALPSTYTRTTLSCFVGIFVQAIITNLTAILFIPMMDLYGFSYAHLGILVGVNFTTQVSADIIFSGLIDKIGYRKLVLPANIFAFVGLLMFALSPVLFSNHIFLGILLSTIMFAFCSGLLEILLSPIVAAIPGNDKGPAMSLMHSFYAWGQVATIIITTLFLFIVGYEHWQFIVFIWAVIPLINFFMFLTSPFPAIVAEEHRQNLTDLIFKPFYILALLAIFFGAGAEVVMNQWASTFMEKGLELPKLTGDLLGMCGFAVMLGVGRTLYGIYGSRFNLSKILTRGSLLAVLCYLIVALSPFNILNIIACIVCGIAVSLLWPGTIVICSERYPLAGAWMFAILAAAGDLGAAFGPWLTGLIVNASADSSLTASLATTLQISAEQGAMRLGILVGVIFPILSFVVQHILAKFKSI